MKLKHFALVVLYSFSCLLWSQQTPIVRDSTSTTFSFRDLNPPDPSSVINKYTYDPITDRYYYTSKVGDYDIKYPIILTPKEFQALKIACCFYYGSNSMHRDSINGLQMNA